MRIFFTISILAAFGIPGCSGISSPNDIVFPATHVSFKAQVEPLFSLACNAAGCHSFDTQAGGVDLTSWIGVRNPIVVNQPGDTTCNLILVIYGRVFHNGAVNINNNARVGVKQWVLEGAQNN